MRKRKGSGGWRYVWEIGSRGGERAREREGRERRGKERERRGR